MKTPEIIKAETDPLVEEAIDTEDSSKLEELFTKACELARQQAVETKDPETRAHLQGYALWLTARKFRRLTGLALKEKAYDQADKHIGNYDNAVTELHRFLVGKIKEGLKLQNIEEPPEKILAQREEFDADFLVAQVESDRSKGPSLGPQIMEKVTSATKKYGSLGRLEDVAGCYLTLSNFYMATGDIENEHRTIDKAAETFLKASEKEGLPEDERARLLATSLGLRGVTSIRYGSLLLARGRPDEAESLFSKAALALRNPANYLVGLGTWRNPRLRLT